jgi:transposase
MWPSIIRRPWCGTTKGRSWDRRFDLAPHQAGLREVVRRVDRWPTTLGTTQGSVGLEPTGRYHEPWVRAFAAVQGVVRLLTPNAVAAERRADQRRAKSDPIDLLAIARCVLAQRGSERLPLEGIPAALRAVSRARRLFVREATRCKNVIRSVVDATF